MNITTRLLLSTLLLSVSAHAIPSVGDSATVRTQESVNGNTISSSVTREVLSIDTANNIIQVKETTTTDAGSSTATINMNLALVASQEENAKTCVNGKKNDVVVPAGQFNACHQEINLNAVDILYDISPEVPFSFVKAVTQLDHGNRVLNSELISFQKATPSLSRAHGSN